MTTRLLADASASSTSPGAITASQATLTLASSANFPAPAAGQQFSVLMLDTGNPNYNALTNNGQNPLAAPFEYQPITLNTVGTNTLTINGGVRAAYAGTTPKAFSPGATIAAVLLAEDLLAAFARIDVANAALLTVAGLVSTAGITGGGHMGAGVYTPAPSLGALQSGIASQGFAGAPYASSTDTEGTVNITTTGSPPTAGSPVAVVSFGTAYTNTPRPQVQANNSGLLLFTKATVTVNGFTIFATVNLNASSSYSIDYWVPGR